MKIRIPIPRETQRKLLIEAGFKCSIHSCHVADTLEFHHIDGNPANNVPSNLLVVCSNHHAQCSKRRIDRKACYAIKKLLKDNMPKHAKIVIDY